MKRTFYIAGVQFRPKEEIKKAMKEIKADFRLVLIPEPTNKFDPNAVKILYITDDLKDFFLGYVPKKFSAEVSGLLEAGIELYCIVKTVNPLGKPWEMCEVVIQDVDESNLDGIPEEK